MTKSTGTGRPPVLGMPTDRRRSRWVDAAVAAVIIIGVFGFGIGAPHAIRGHAAVAATAGSGALRAPEPVVKTVGNPLLDKGITLAPATCRLPQLGRSPAQLEAYYDALTTCLATAWRPALTRANEPSIAVKVSVTLPKKSACGAAPSPDSTVAYYCAGDLTIYAPVDWMLADGGLVSARHLATIAHEYGHHVQRESGIIEAAAQKMSNAQNPTPADDGIVRRLELQANCFGGLFLEAAAGHGSISRALANAAVADYSRGDDSVDHGTHAHQVSWAEAGYAGAGPAACDTWSAPADQVS